jgi:hypothetical protein
VHECVELLGRVRLDVVAEPLGLKPVPASRYGRSPTGRLVARAHARDRVEQPMRSRQKEDELPVKNVTERLARASTRHRWLVVGC